MKLTPHGCSLDINYGGSSGFGRAFRESLDGKWGVLDVEDTYQSVLKLDELGLVDANRAVVHGGSAGGYTVLQIATTLPTAFAAGSPHYGVSDMRRLDEILHKFEYYLCDRLMGGPWEECESVWRERSPIYHADKIKMPLLVRSNHVYMRYHTTAFMLGSARRERHGCARRADDHHGGHD